MMSTKKALSGESAHDTLKRAMLSRQAYSKKVGKIPAMSQDHHEAQMRNHTRMKRSKG